MVYGLGFRVYGLRFRSYSRKYPNIIEHNSLSSPVRGKSSVARGRREERMLQPLGEKEEEMNCELILS